MQPTPVASFVRFLLGFVVFISLSFGVTYAVSNYSSSQDAAHQQAAAEAAMLGIK